MKFGISTADQDASGQKDRFMGVGAIRVFTDVISGARAKRPALTELFDHARPGDSLCVTCLDCLGWSRKELLEIVEDLKERSIHLVSLEEDVDTSSAAEKLDFHDFRTIAHFGRWLIAERTATASRRPGNAARI